MTSGFPEGLFFDLVRQDEVPAAYELEKAAFSPKEAASLDKIKIRQSVAPKLFLGTYIPTTPRTLIGYANATLASSSTLTAASMHTHDPSGTSVCVHAVAVADVHRRLGVASALLKEYIRRLEDDPTVGSTQAERVLLICHDDLIPLYTSVGFVLRGKSPVVHGPHPWFEMRVELGSVDPQEPLHTQGAVPLDVLGALASQPRNRPAARLFSSFTSSSALVSKSGENAFDILCPRPGCGSIILKYGAAKFQHAPSVELEPFTQTPPSPLPRLPPPPAVVDWWLITPSPMAFENIAFSRPVPSSSSSATHLKLLACAECDLGALGWSKEGGREFWLAVSRVGYRQCYGLGQ